MALKAARDSNVLSRCSLSSLTVSTFVAVVVFVNVVVVVVVNVNVVVVVVVKTVVVVGSSKSISLRRASGGGVRVANCFI